jgi:hypothetical protein
MISSKKLWPLDHGAGPVGMLVADKYKKWRIDQARPVAWPSISRYLNQLDIIRGAIFDIRCMYVRVFMYVAAVIYVAEQQLKVQD